jgi:hypothetical protein
MIANKIFIELNLEQSEEVLAVLTNVRKPSDNLKASMSAIKGVIKHEAEVQSIELDNLIQRISDSGFKDLEMIDKLQKEAIEIKGKASQVKDKYFDGLGNEK